MPSGVAHVNSAVQGGSSKFWIFDKILTLKSHSTTGKKIIGGIKLPAQQRSTPSTNKKLGNSKNLGWQKEILDKDGKIRWCANRQWHGGEHTVKQPWLLYIACSIVHACSICFVCQACVGAWVSARAWILLNLKRWKTALIKDAGHPRLLWFNIILLIVNKPEVKICFLKKNLFS